MRRLGIVILLGFGAALILPRACRAQEVSPDHFTETGVQDVFPAAPHHVAAPRLKPTPPALQARNNKTNSPATLQLAAKRDSSLSAQPDTLALQEKRKNRPPLNPKKPQ